MKCPKCRENISLFAVRSRFECPHCGATIHAKNINLAIYLPTIILALLPIFVPLPKDWLIFIPVIIAAVVFVYYLAVKTLISYELE